MREVIGHIGRFVVLILLQLMTEVLILFVSGQIEPLFALLSSFVELSFLWILLELAVDQKWVSCCLWVCISYEE